MTNTQKTIATIGPAVEDLIVKTSHPCRRGKQAAEFAFQIGGSAINDARQLSGLGCCRIAPIALVGTDQRGQALKMGVREEFPHAGFIEYPGPTRMSVIVDDTTYTSRPPLHIERLPLGVQYLLAGADALMVAPFPAEDYDLVSQILQLNKRTLLKLSTSQLQDQTAAFRLLSMCSLSVLNADEAGTLVGESDPAAAAAAARIHDATGCQVIVTSADQVCGWIDNKPCRQRSFGVPVRQTSGAGDQFSATLLACLVSDYSFETSMELAAAAAARHVAGLPACRLDQLAAWAAQAAADSLPSNRSDVGSDWNDAVAVGVSTRTA